VNSPILLFRIRFFRFAHPVSKLFQLFQEEIGFGLKPASLSV